MAIKDTKIMIIEDEPQISRLIELVLQSDGFYKIRKAFDGQEALEMIKADKPDLILLDVMLPSLDGYTLCKKIREDIYLNTIQIIMLTAKKLEDDILKGFEYGANDYISKPFSNKILLARIKALLNNNTNLSVISYKNISIDDKRKIVKIGDKPVDLTNFEFKLLKIFIANIGVVFSRSQLLSYLRGDEGFNVSERAMDVQILNLRRKLANSGACIETIRGVGYKLKEISL